MHTIPGGREKGTPLAEASNDSLRYWVDRIRGNLNEGTSRNPGSDQAWLAEAEAILGEGGSTGATGATDATGGHRQQYQQPRAAQPRNNALARYQGAHNDAKAATTAMAKLQEVGHLVTPSPAVAMLPMGTAVVISAIKVDPVTETYQVQAGRGLAKVALDKIAAASGVSWSNESGRLDDGSDPRFVHFRAVGYVKEFDGTPRRIQGEKILDLRDGSPTVEALQNRAEEKAKKSGEREGDWRKQVRDMRMFILEHAESKARNRAIRSLGVRTSYTAEELRKPFFAAKVQFTGQSDDPEIKRLFAQHIASAFSGSAAMLYGRAQRSPRRAQVGYTPPPRTVEDDDPYIDAEGYPAPGTIEHEDGIPMEDEF